MPVLRGPARAEIAALRVALSNDGIRRLELAWMLGVAADTALLVVFLVVVYQRDGILATGLLGAARMVPAIAAGMLSGSLLQRFRGDRILVAIGLSRAISALLAALVIATDGSTAFLFVLAAAAAAAGAPVRPTMATLMPALARSPRELVAANMAWSTGEGLGAFAGPFVAGLLVARALPDVAALVAAGGFVLTTLAVAGLRFEHAADASGGAAGGGLRLIDGVRALRRRSVPGWAMVGVFGQVLTRGLLSALIVVASIELVGMGDGGVGLLNAALGVGGLFGAVFALGLARADQLVRTMCASLACWGPPIALIGLLPSPPVALLAMGVVGVANATYDVALITILQRGSSNDERGSVFSVLEAVVGLGAVSGSLLAPVFIAAFGARGSFAVAGSILPILALILYNRVGRTDRITVVDEPTMQLLRAVPAFAELPMTAVERLASGLVRETFPAGATLMRQGDDGDRFLVIASGEIEVFVDGQSVHRLGRGSGVGDVALVRRTKRTATVVAVTDVTAETVDCRTFLAAISGPAAAAATERMAAAHLARSAPSD